LFDPDIVLKQLPKQTLMSLHLQTPLAFAMITLTTNSNTIQVPITPTNVVQVEDLLRALLKVTLSLI
jgi:hypothetical protein